MTTSPRVLVVATLALAAAAGGAAFDLSRRSASGAERSASFQRFTGGLGSGAALDLSGCAAEFDARADDTCPDHLEPLPGGDVFCPRLGAPRGERRLR